MLPAGAPAAVQQIVAAANSIIDTDYEWGGGHASFQSSGYDCSGAVSFALHGGGLLSSPEDSTGLESYGRPGMGTWVTVYSDPAHAFLVVDGRAFDTADYGGPNIPSGSGPRWRSNPTGNLRDGGGYVARHPAGSSRGGRRQRLGGTEVDRHQRPAARGVGGGRGAVVRLGGLAHDRQPEPRAGRGARGPRPVEAVEHERQVRLLKAPAVVAHREAAVAQPHLDLIALPAPLHRVVEQIRRPPGRSGRPPPARAWARARR